MEETRKNRSNSIKKCQVLKAFVKEENNNQNILGWYALKFH